VVCLLASQKKTFKAYFEKFGRITDVVIMYDSSTHRPRGFGFITFDSVEAVDCVLQKKFHELNNKTVQVKVAVPKDSSNQNNLSDSNGCMGGGRGPALSNDQKGYYPPYSPRYEVYPGYAPPPVPLFFMEQLSMVVDMGFILVMHRHLFQVFFMEQLSMVVDMGFILVMYRRLFHVFFM